MRRSQRQLTHFSTLRGLLCAGVLCAAPSQAQAATRRVPEDYGTIQAAWNAAQDGDEISIAPGTYQEDLQLLHGTPWLFRLRLAGRQEPRDTVLVGSVRLHFDGREPVESYVQLANLTVRAAPGAHGPGILLIGHPLVEITNCIVESHAGGITYEHGRELVVDRSVIRNNGRALGSAFPSQSALIRATALISNGEAASLGGTGGKTLSFEDSVVAGNESGIRLTSRLGQHTLILQRTAFLNHPQGHLAVDERAGDIEDLGGNTFISPQPPTVTFEAVPAQIPVGHHSALQWQAQESGAICCLSGPSLTEPCSRTGQGSVSVQPQLTTTYQLMCWHAGGVVTQQATVAVGPVTPIRHTLQPIADATVSSRTPHRNFGREARLKVDATATGSEQETSYLMFELPPPPAGWRIVEAHLRLHLARGATTGTRVWRLPAVLWQEHAITFANRPPVGGYQHGPWGSTSNDGWAAIPVPQEFIPSAYPGGRVTFALQGVSSAPEAAYHSRESAFAPELEVVYFPL